MIQLIHSKNARSKSRSAFMSFTTHFYEVSTAADPGETNSAGYDCIMLNVHATMLDVVLSDISQRHDFR